MDLGYISVVDNKDMLSFKVVPPKIDEEYRRMSLTTGVKGFLNMLEINGDLVYKAIPIIYNGVLLNKEGERQFWQQIEELKNE